MTFFFLLLVSRYPDASGWSRTSIRFFVFCFGGSQSSMREMEEGICVDTPPVGLVLHHVKSLNLNVYTPLSLSCEMCMCLVG
jgi:hypothetical protein